MDFFLLNSFSLQLQSFYTVPSVLTMGIFYSYQQLIKRDALFPECISSVATTLGSCPSLTLHEPPLPFDHQFIMTGDM